MTRAAPSLAAIANPSRAAISAAAALGPPAIAQVPQPTLKFDRACSTEGQRLQFSGVGYSPGWRGQPVTRSRGQQPPESQFGVAQLTFTRWEGFSPGRYVPGKQVSVELYGWAFATGKMAWLQFRQGPRTVASVKVGRLDQECGDRKAKVKVPRNLESGRYRIVLATAPRQLSAAYTWRSGRVIAEP